MQENIDLRDYGYRDSGTPDIARITAVFKNRYDLITPAGATHGFLSAAYRQGLEDWPTTGDFVRIDPNPTGDSPHIGDAAASFAVQPERTRLPAAPAGRGRQFRLRVHSNVAQPRLQSQSSGALPVDRLRLGRNAGDYC